MATSPTELTCADPATSTGLPQTARRPEVLPLRDAFLPGAPSRHPPPIGPDPGVGPELTPELILRESEFAIWTQLCERFLAAGNGKPP